MPLEPIPIRDFVRKAQPHPPVGQLTPRERQVLALIGNGYSTRELAHELGITFKTAACHRSRILLKLNARNTADLTRAAIRLRLIVP